MNQHVEWLPIELERLQGVVRDYIELLETENDVDLVKVYQQILKKLERLAKAT